MHKLSNLTVCARNRRYLPGAGGDEASGSNVNKMQCITNEDIGHRINSVTLTVGQLHK